MIIQTPVEFLILVIAVGLIATMDVCIAINFLYDRKMKYLGSILQCIGNELKKYQEVLKGHDKPSNS